MKPILTVRMDDKKTEATLNTLFEDLYNRVIPSEDILRALRAGKLDRPHIDSTNTGYDRFGAWIYVHSVPVSGALIYCWAVRKYGTMRWSEYFSSNYEVKIPGLDFATDYEIRVKAYGSLVITSEWSLTTIVKTVSAPKPSTVTGITVTNESLYVDPTTGVTLASVKVSWNDNQADELVDVYEVLWE